MDHFYSKSNGSECCMKVEQSGTSNVVTDLAVPWAQVKLLLKPLTYAWGHFCLAFMLPHIITKLYPRELLTQFSLYSTTFYVFFTSRCFYLLDRVRVQLLLAKVFKFD